jgi:DNA-binding NtrC family response regulator
MFMPTEILIVDDDPAMCDVLADALQAAGLATTVSTSADAGLLELQDGRYQAVVTDLCMHGMEGFEFCDRVASAHPELPVIVMTAFGSVDTAAAARRIGAIEFLNKPFDPADLAQAIKRITTGLEPANGHGRGGPDRFGAGQALSGHWKGTHMSESREQGKHMAWFGEEIELDEPGWDPSARRILVAEDDREMSRLLDEALREDGYEVMVATDGSHLRDYIDYLRGTILNGRFFDVDLIVSDVRMPGASGLDVLAEMRLHDRQTPVIIITAFGDDRTHAEAGRLGAAAVFDKPFDLDAFRAFVRRLVPPTSARPPLP